jgi:hypothetical protein
MVSVFAEPPSAVYRAAATTGALLHSLRHALRHALRQETSDSAEAVRWPELVGVFAEACASGRAGDAAELLLAEGYDQRWRPLYAALRAVEAGDPARLSRFAPEVRVPAAALLERLAPALAAAPPGPKVRGPAKKR